MNNIYIYILPILIPIVLYVIIYNVLYQNVKENMEEEKAQIKRQECDYNPNGIDVREINGTTGNYGLIGKNCKTDTDCGDNFKRHFKDGCIFRCENLSNDTKNKVCTTNAYVNKQFKSNGFCTIS